MQGGQVEGDVGAVTHGDDLLLAQSPLGVHGARAQGVDHDSKFGMGPVSPEVTLCSNLPPSL